MLYASSRCDNRARVQVLTQQSRRMCRSCLYSAQYARVAQAIRTERLIVDSDHVLLALSGGACTVCLLLYLCCVILTSNLLNFRSDSDYFTLAVIPCCNNLYVPYTWYCLKGLSFLAFGILRCECNLRHLSSCMKTNASLCMLVLITPCCASLRCSLLCRLAVVLTCANTIVVSTASTRHSSRACRRKAARW